MADFTWKPDLVEPSTPRDNILKTPSENFRQVFYEVDSNEEQLFTLVFGDISKIPTAGPNSRDLIYAHFRTHKLFLNSFSWTNVPTYISDDFGTPITVRYWRYTEIPKSDGNIWNVSMVFRKEV